MSGHHPPHQPPGGGGGGRGWSPLPPHMVGAPTPPPLMYRPPSPYTSSPPPRLMGSPMSPMFGARLPFMPCPRPRWAVPPPPGVSRSPTPSGPRPFIPMPPHSPAGSPILCPSPEFYYSGISPYSDVGPPCHDYEYVGVPLEPPGPPRPPPLHIDGDEPQDGMSTADIIANQSQDYIDEKLAEYQATIQQLQVCESSDRFAEYGCVSPCQSCWIKDVNQTKCTRKYYEKRCKTGCACPDEYCFNWLYSRCEPRVNFTGIRNK